MIRKKALLDKVCSELHPMHVIHVTMYMYVLGLCSRGAKMPWSALDFTRQKDM